MTKFILTLFFAFSLLILSNVESKGQCSSCPTNYTPKSFTATLPNTSCEIQFNICVNCAPTGHPEVQFCSAYIYNNTECSNVSITAVDWQKMKMEVMGKVLEDCQTTIPPCSTQSRAAANYYEAFCLEAVYNGVEDRVELIPCDLDPGVCRVEYTACMEDDIIEVEIESGPTVVETGECGPGYINPPFPPPSGCWSFCY